VFSRLAFKIAALLTVFFLFSSPCLPAAGAHEPGFLTTSTAIVTVDQNGELGGDFTNGYFPTERSEVVWVTAPEYGRFDYDQTSRLMLYTPAPHNHDRIDTFVVYATNGQGNWNITRFFFDPATRELTFATDISIDPAMQNSEVPYDLCTGSPTPVTQGDGWTRFWGGVKLVGGVVESAGGVVIGVGTGWTGVGAVAGGAVALHGADTAQAGLQQLWYGEEVRTLTSQAVSGTAHHVFGVDEDRSVVIGEVVDAGIGLAGGVGTAAKGPQVVDKFADVFELSTSVRIGLPGGGHIDDTINVADDVSGVILAVGAGKAAGEGARLGDAAADLPGSGSGGLPAAAPRKVRSIDAQGRKHILDGEENGGGGHRFGTGRSKKSEFPASWSDDRIIDTIVEIANDPNVVWSKPDHRGYVTGSKTIDGLDILVVFDTKKERIVSGYPTNVPRNP
jgi:hypothetical protein